MSNADIAKLIDRARTQIRTGIMHMERGDYLTAETWLRPALATLDALQAVLDGPQKPLRKLAVVRASTGEEVEIEPWMATKHNGSEPDGAA